jgi:hypothetical protein
VALTLAALLSYMNPSKTAIYSGLTSMIIGLIVYSVSWNFSGLNPREFFSGPLPGYCIFVFQET